MSGPCDLTAERVARRHRRLYKAAVKHFGSWHKALAAAGVNPDHIQPCSPADRPTTRELLEELKKRSQQGKSVRWRDMCRENSALSRTIRTKFGSMTNAHFAAGLIDQPNTRTKTIWNREKVLTDLRERHRLGVGTSRIWREAPILASAAWRYFGGVEQALAAARVDEDVDPAKTLGLSG